MHRVAVTLAVALAMQAPGARAQDTQWRTHVQTYLNRAVQSFSASGYGQVRETQIGSLPDQEDDSFTLTLHAGTTYALVGVCDDDCSDLDLVLYDANDKQVDSDVASDDVPIVQVTPIETMRYRVKVIMAACRTNPCWYGIGTYGR